MKELVENLNQLFADFTKDAASQVESGNKSAGQRARKISLEIEKVLKQFRKDSVAAGK
ncbi:histone H1 [Dysgonomonas sp. GY75]|uniref:histone H1 n=1 Tax=Dysgonomonas sp. GY75 TaxID=2780419 RepID=UPI001884257A|nr:histone H1 [Dysgonomonas sp. GY75]MBF0647374.1 histone H1 [Dysgonomonas sp. GY75]